jgi:hypothetical protein
MDDQRFDNVTRALRSGASRRRVLRGLMAAAVGGLGVGSLRRGAQAQETPLSGGEACGGVICGAGDYCCNESCGICAPLGGFCTAQFCGEVPGEPCNQVTCGPGEFCCNWSCSTCAPAGGACTDQFCMDDGLTAGTLVVTTDALNYRTGPGLGAAIIMVLAPGTEGRLLMVRSRPMGTRGMPSASPATTRLRAGLRASSWRADSRGNQGAAGGEGLGERCAADRAGRRRGRRRRVGRDERVGITGGGLGTRARR